MSSKTTASDDDRRRPKPNSNLHTPSSTAPQQAHETQRPPNSRPLVHMAQQLFGSTPAGKVAIPPLHPRIDPIPATVAVEKKRTSKACVECRSRKIKCSGKRPTCEHCEQCQIPCVYADGKREQNKRATERGDRLVQLLREITQEVHLPSHLMEKVRAVEYEVPDDDQSVRSEITTASRKRRKSSANLASHKRARSISPTSEQGEADVAADVGSEESVDLAAEDFNRTERSRATGFIGKNSEVAWAQRLAQAQIEGQIGYNEQRDYTTNYGRPGTNEDAVNDRLSASRLRHRSESKQDVSIADYTYHLDSESVLTVEYIDKDDFPPIEVAEHLMNCYMDTVQDVWPILTKSDFLNQFQQYSRSKNPLVLPVTWRAILNMVFAIGAKFSHLIGAPWRGDRRDHLIYYTRAMNLAVPSDAIVAHPDLQRIQVVGLIAFYYLTISQISRSWIMIGLGCRQAIALGLHLRNMDPSISAISKEKRVRVWWSLYTFEYLLCEFTGRPTAIEHRFCSVPAPAPIDEINLLNSPGAKQLEEWNYGQADKLKSSSKRFAVSLETVPNSANQFRARAQLAVISQKVLANLYSAETVSKSWERAQEEIVALGEEVDQWYRTLPPEYQFTRQESNDQFHRERVLLGFGYYSTKILLNRPCLCRVDRRIRKQGERSKDLDTERAQECIMAARSMSDLIPDVPVPDMTWLYYKAPWWCIVHHLMQAITIFMLEIAFENCHLDDMKVDVQGLLRLSWKLLRWLTVMAATGNTGARSACKQLRQQFKGFAPFENIDVSYLVQMAEQGTNSLGQPPYSETQTEMKPQGQEVQEPNPGTIPQDGAFDNLVEDHNVWPKAEQPSFTQEYDHRQDYPVHGSFPQQNTLRFQEADLAQSQSLPDHSWQNIQWDLNADPLWNSAVLQTSYDLLNPFTSSDNSMKSGFTSAEPAYSLRQTMDGITADFFDGHNAGASHVGTTRGAYDTVMNEAEQRQQHQAYLGGLQQDPQAPHHHQ